MLCISNYRRLTELLFAIVTIICLVFGSDELLADSDSLYIAIEPQSISALTWDTVQIAVVVSPISGLYATGFDFEYDPASIGFVKAYEGCFLNASGSVNTAFVKSVDSLTGRVIIGITRTQASAGGASCLQETPLVFIDLVAKSSGIHALYITRSSLIGTDGETHFPHLAYGGQIDAQPTSAADADQKYTNLPTDMSVSQNWPNPFNSSTMFEIDNRKNQNITAEVYDLLGRHVSTIIDTRLTQGIHVLEWDAADSFGGLLPSGVYFLKVSSESSTRTRKMLFLK